jgi:hypothetical protein
MSGTMGISVGGAIFSSEIVKRLNKISGYQRPIGETAEQLVNDVGKLKHIQVSYNYGFAGKIPTENGVV